MIADNLYTSLTDYGSMDNRLACAFEWLKKTDLKALFTKPDRTIEIDGMRVYAMIQSYMTQPASEFAFETHRAYIDVQIMVEGVEVIDWTPFANLPIITIPYNYEKDVIFFKDPAHSLPIRIADGDYAVFFPSDGHKPRCQAETPAPVKKIVVKVAV